MTSASEIKVYPKDEKILSKQCENVSSDDINYKDELKSMLSTVQKLGGRGIAAPQIGSTKNMVVIILLHSELIDLEKKGVLILTEKEKTELSKKYLCAADLSWQRRIHNNKQIVLSFSEQEEIVLVKVRMGESNLSEKEKDDLMSALQKYSEKVEETIDLSKEEIVNLLKKKVITMINPTIEWRSEGMKESIEGCFSIPDKVGRVSRHESVSVKYYDKNFRKITIEQADFELSCCLQHEIDHLHGILFMDRMGFDNREAAWKSLPSLEEFKRQLHQQQEEHSQE